jgi:hypothetical protein
MTDPARNASPAPPPYPSRGAYLGLAIVTIAIGLAVHFHAHWLGDARDILGDGLWAAMMVWWISALVPTAPLTLRLAVAYAVAAVVEASQALPAHDTHRHTQVGHLVLGTDFDPRDFASYAAGVLAAGLIDLWLSRRAHMRAAGS